MNTHYGVIVCSVPPSITLIASGEPEFCWDAVRQWTDNHPLQKFERVEVLARDPAVVPPSALVVEGDTDD